MLDELYKCDKCSQEYSWDEIHSLSGANECCSPTMYLECICYYCAEKANEAKSRDRDSSVESNKECGACTGTLGKPNDSVGIKEEGHHQADRRDACSCRSKHRCGDNK